MIQDQFQRSIDEIVDTIALEEWNGLGERDIDTFRHRVLSRLRELGRDCPIEFLDFKMVESTGTSKSFYIDWRTGEPA